jgi:superoxide dismutase, Cu-Zn family
MSPREPQARPGKLAPFENAKPIAIVNAKMCASENFMRSKLWIGSLFLILLCLGAPTLSRAESAMHHDDKAQHQEKIGRTLTVPMNLATEQDNGAPIGAVVISQTRYGLVFTPALANITPGLHGFHVHTNPSCAAQEKDGKPVPALAAGGHYDPAGTQQHGLPWGDGHLGDLPALYVDATGKANTPVLAPRLKLKDLAGRALMIHMGGDNYADRPALLGGGGARVACGVIPAKRVMPEKLEGKIEKPEKP